MDQSIWDLMSHGGGAMWVVVAFSVIALAVAIERAIAQWKFVTRARALGETVTRCLSRGALEEGRSACERSPSPIADVFLVGYERLGRAQARARRHRGPPRAPARQPGPRARGCGCSAPIGATAPFVGLFGTVVGIMTAMGGFKGDEEVKFSMVSGPISEALIVTAAGILVAVEAVILFNFFSQRANRIATEMKLLTDEFLELLLEQPGDSQPTREQAHDARRRKPTTSRPNRKTRTKGDGDGDREAA